MHTTIAFVKKGNAYSALKAFFKDNNHKKGEWISMVEHDQLSWRFHTVEGELACKACPDTVAVPASSIQKIILDALQKLKGKRIKKASEIDELLELDNASKYPMTKRRNTPPLIIKMDLQRSTTTFYANEVLSNQLDSFIPAMKQMYGKTVITKSSTHWLCYVLGEGIRDPKSLSTISAQTR